MFYAHFVLSKKGPLARIWLAAHWDKKLTKAHVFETNIDSSVEAIMQPKVKLALRTSGHLLLGVVRIYSRKAKYLLADCNEAFVKIKMAFRPGVVDLPEENREAAVAAITLQENFHDFDTTLADLNDLDMHAQFSVNQSRPEDITMREDLSSIAFVGDDGFGDVGFDDREILRDDSEIDDSLYTNRSSIRPVEAEEKTLNEHTSEKPMDVDLNPVVDNDDFGGAVDGGFMGNDFMNGGGLFEDAPLPVGEVSMPAPLEAEKPAEDKDAQNNETTNTTSATEPTMIHNAPGTSGEQTTLINNEEEAFALPPLDATLFPGAEKKKRKRKLIVDEQKGFPSETMKLQLSDTSDIITTLDLAPPTKKLMHWKETGGVEKLFGLPGRAIISKTASKLFSRNLITRQVKEEEESDQDKLDLEATEILREEQERSAAPIQEVSTIIEEPSVLEESTASTRSKRRERPSLKSPKPVPTPSREPDLSLNNTTNPQFSNTFTEAPVDLPGGPPSLLNPHLDPYETEPPSIAPFSVPPPSVPPQSVPPPSVLPHDAPSFNVEAEVDNDAMPENEEQEEKRWTKRTQLMQHSLDVAFRYKNTLSFKEMSRNLNRKQACSKFYTLLVLKKYQAIEVQQPQEFGDIYIDKGPKFGLIC
ncbi:double-strand-break repair protein rad21 homolog isoform X2 [Saccostrea cucullata]|uniref:double-strand-break repair protein rad21 homolog isoform X2 n=1 Tax=Saccostrea cuccullata TaxID=36930 RepID=UPI002ED18ABE